MAKGNSLLRNIFGFFNLLFAIFGSLVIILAIIAHVHISNVEEFEKIGGVVLLYVIGFITLSISFLGAYGAFREVKWMLVVFLVLMCVGFLFLVRIAVALAISRPQINHLANEAMNEVLPLDKTSQDFQDLMNEFQSWFKCCGLVNGYQDWENSVPGSCNCQPGDSEMSGVCADLPEYSLEALIRRHKTGRLVYNQPCGPILKNIFFKIFDGMMGIFFGLTALTVLGIAFSSCLIAQINKSRTPTLVVAPAMMFTPSPPKYNELINEPYN